MLLVNAKELARNQVMDLHLISKKSLTRNEPIIAQTVCRADTRQIIITIAVRIRLLKKTFPRVQILHT